MCLTPKLDRKSSQGEGRLGGARPFSASLMCFRTRGKVARANQRMDRPVVPQVCSPPSDHSGLDGVLAERRARSLTQGFFPFPSSFTAYGVDGCPAGWLFVALFPSTDIDWGVVGTLDELVERASDSDRIFVDIPIGLPNGPGQRECDIAARKVLAPRSGSVFPAPVCEVFGTTSFPEAQLRSRKVRGKAFQSRRSRSHRRLSRSTRCSGDARERGVSSVRFTPRFASGRSPAVALWQSCQGRRETRPKGGAKHCHRGRGGEVVRGGRDWAWGGGSRKRREGVARLEFPAEDGATISLRGRFSSRGCG